MSIYASSSSWGCSSANQSPINLSQSSAKPCDLLCELVMDQVQVPQANVIISDEGLILQNEAGLGTCKYNGEGFTCTTLMVNHPSHHTIENIQADAEVIAIFGNPSGKYLCLSSLVRINSSHSGSTQFFNKFVGFANPSQDMTQVNLGDDWGLHMMVPPNGSYFVYDGSMVIPNCQPAKWVVFKSMINMDSNDFALLVKNVSPGSRPVQALGDREVYFNDIEQLPGSPMPHDGKTYMRCRRLGKSGPQTKTGVKDVQSAGVKEARDEAERHSGKPNAVSKWVQEQIEINGFLEFVNFALTIAALVFGVRYGYSSEYRFIGEKLYIFSFDVAAWIRGFLDRYIFSLFQPRTPLYADQRFQ